MYRHAPETCTLLHSLPPPPCHRRTQYHEHHTTILLWLHGASNNPQNVVDDRDVSQR